MRAATCALVTTVLCGAVGSSAWAIKEPETGLTFPDQSSCAGEPARAVGVGVREATFGVDVYGVVLYASAAAKGQSLRQTAACVKIQARFVRDVGADKIRKAWLDGLKKKGLPASERAVRAMLGVITSEMKKKQLMVIECRKDSVQFHYMGRNVTVDRAAQLSRAIRRIYLDAGSPTPSLVKDIAKRKLARP